MNSPSATMKEFSYPTPPIAERITTSSRHHGYEILDPYAWLRDPEYPKVTDPKILSYLEEENAYFNAVMAPQNDLKEAIFEEIKGRLREDEDCVPWVEGAYEYRWAFQIGQEYRVWYRRAIGSESWQVLLDENFESAGSDFFRLGSVAISPNGQLMAYSADRDGSERYVIKVRDLTTGQEIDFEVGETSGEIVWSADSQGIYYVVVSTEWRPYLVQHTLISKVEPRDVYEESDDSFFTHITRSSDGAFMFIRTADHVTAEVRALDLAMGADGTPRLFMARQDGHDYDVDHGQGKFFIRSNKDHLNFGLYAAPTIGDGWLVLKMGTEDCYIRAHQVFDNFVAIQERVQGLDQIQILAADGNFHYIAFPEEAYEATLGNNSQANQHFVRVTYNSMISPLSVYDYHPNTGDLKLRKEQVIPSGYDKSAYKTKRLMVKARDGEMIPVSIVMPADWERHQGAPLHLYGYGAYGIGMSPSFSAARLSLLDRGFAYAIAHIRGGDELGYNWYQAGKLDQRTNSFNDFVDVAGYLIDAGFAAKGGITISGGSAGGELMGAAVNQAPEVFKAVVMHVPFVDVLNTMLDGSLPLTPIEWPEWGNPLTDKTVYEYMRSYCPYTNIRTDSYPPVMVTGGLNDPRVTYWEPAKFTARLRHRKDNDNLVIMKINMGAGHGGKSGRFERLYEVAEEYVFLLMAFGLE